MIGAIVDVFLEGEESFRGCVFDLANNDGIWVINLKDGEKRLAFPHEYEGPVIQNIFDFDIDKH